MLEICCSGRSDACGRFVGTLTTGVSEEGWHSSSNPEEGVGAGAYLCDRREVCRLCHEREDVVMQSIVSLPGPLISHV